MARLARLCGLAIALAGCGGTSLGAQATPTLPLLTPFPYIASTPSFQTWAALRILRFREERGPSTAEGEGYLGFGLQILAPSAVLPAVEAGQYELVVSSLEPPAGWFATPLGSEAIAFAVHPSNPVRELSLADLKLIYLGQSTNWSGYGGADLEIVPVIPLRGDEVREAVAEAVLGNLRFTTNALLGPTPEATRALIREHPGAIGILPLSASGEGVKLLRIGGIGPDAGEERYPLRLEVLGFAPEEPAGVVREWLAWLQAEGG